MRKAVDLAQAVMGMLAMVLFLAGGLLHVPWLMTAGWVVLALMGLVLAYWAVRLARLLLRLRWIRRTSRAAARRRKTQQHAGWELK